MAHAPQFSIVIPTHNRAELLQRVIALLIKQSVTASEYEIVVADSASSDTTPEVLKRLASELPNLRSVRLEQPGAAIARNGGLAAATGQMVVLIDDDILVRPDFIETLRNAAGKHAGCVLLGLIEAPWEDSTDPFLRYLLQAQDVNCYAFPDPCNVPAAHFYTACIAIPRDLIKELRFDENFGGAGLEDMDFGLRLLSGGTRMVYIPELKVLHEYYPEYPGYRKRKFRLGHSLGYFVSKDPKNAAYFYVEPNWTRRWYRLYVALLAPLARRLLLRENERKRKGPLPGALYTFIQRDLRVQLYDGMRDYARQNIQRKSD